MTQLLIEVIERLWPGREVAVESLAGGITNANFKVDLGTEQLVVRVPGKNTELLGINRASEVAANRIAAAIGVAPEIVAVDEKTGCMVTRFVEGRTIPMAELATEPTLGEVIATLVRVHRAGSLEVNFDHFQIIRAYHDEARRRGVSEPFDYAEASAVLSRIEAARPFRPQVLGHNDLLNANLLHDGSVRILDWEYAGMADPYFDLANFSVNNELGSEHDRAILGHYFGSADSAKLATLAHEAGFRAARGDVGSRPACRVRARRGLRRLRHGAWRAVPSPAGNDGARLVARRGGGGSSRSAMSGCGCCQGRRAALRPPPPPRNVRRCPLPHAAPG